MRRATFFTDSRGTFFSLSISLAAVLGEGSTMSVRSCPPCGPDSNTTALRTWLERLILQEVAAADHDHAVRP